MKPLVVKEPLRLSEAEGGGPGDYSRADLIFYGVDHSGPSYEARIYLNNPRADVETPRELKDGYAGSFTVFGHDGCAGVEGHCDTEAREVDAFDLRPPHPLTPWTKVVEITEAFNHLEGETQFVISVVAVVPGERGPELTDALVFERVRLALYAA